MSKTTFGTYHYSVKIGHGKTTFPTVALGSMYGALAFFWKGRGVQFPWLSILTNVSVCFIQFSKSCGESNILSCKSRVQSRKEGIEQITLSITACYPSSISKAISNPKIILISASRISPFNSISTTI